MNKSATGLAEERGKINVLSESSAVERVMKGVSIAVEEARYGVAILILEEPFSESESESSLAPSDEFVLMMGG